MTDHPAVEQATTEQASHPTDAELRATVVKSADAELRTIAQAEPLNRFQQRKAGRSTARQVERSPAPAPTEAEIGAARRRSVVHYDGTAHVGGP
jgi:hypothetical protein